MLDWKEVPPLFPREALHPAAIGFADSREAAGVWCVAFSGGADSLAVLLSVYAHWPERRVQGRLVALHFNHCLRGAESDADEQFCRDVCAALDMEICVGTWTEAKADASEGEARAARWDFFTREMRACRARVLWTGHQKDDIAETLLMRIARGSGAAGLAAPRPVQVHRDGVHVLRPLLTLGKAEIVAALKGTGAPWREDASNATGEFFRNRMRRDVLPLWRAAAINDAFAGAALTRELLDEDNAALDAWLDELVPPGAYAQSVLDLTRLAGKPQALWRRALRRWGPLSELARVGFEDVLARSRANGGIFNAGDGWVTVKSGVLAFCAERSTEKMGGWIADVLKRGGVVVSPAGGELAADAVEFTEELRARIMTGCVDAEREAFVAVVDDSFTVRSWTAGDRYRPLGAPGSAKLQDLFVNKKIPEEERSLRPVVCRADGEILWVPGFPPAEKSKMADDSVTGTRLTYQIGTNTVRPQSHTSKCPTSKTTRNDVP